MKRMSACLLDSVDTQASHFLTLDRNQGWYYMRSCAVAVYIQNQYLVDRSRSSNKIPYIQKAKQFINISRTHTDTPTPTPTQAQMSHTRKCYWRTSVVLSDYENSDYEFSSHNLSDDAVLRI